MEHFKLVDFFYFMNSVTFLRKKKYFILLSDKAIKKKKKRKKKGLDLVNPFTAREPCVACRVTPAEEFLVFILVFRLSAAAHATYCTADCFRTPPAVKGLRRNMWGGGCSAPGLAEKPRKSAGKIK